MKKIVAGAVALVCAASMFAADFAAKVYLTGDVAGGETDKDTYIWKMNKQDQKDADALVVSTNGDNAGANFQFWYNYDASGKADLLVRSTSIWFKPVDMLKVTLGDVEIGTYKEMLHWWKDPAGGSYAQAGSWDHGYSSYATVSGSGITFELTPMSGLYITGGIISGADSNFVTFVKNADKPTIKAYGAAVKLDLNALASIPLTAAVSWRDEGTNATKVLAIGADYGNAWANGIYAMLNARMLFDDSIAAYGSGEKTYLTGISFDNYFKFTKDALCVEARLPFVLRGLAKDLLNGADASVADPSYMFWEFRVKYALDGFTPYLNVGTDIRNNHDGWVFYKENMADTFNVDIKPGVTFNVGAASFDVSALISIKDAVAKNDGSKYRPIQWSIPFEVGLAF